VLTVSKNLGLYIFKSQRFVQERQAQLKVEQKQTRQSRKTLEHLALDENVVGK
jgi:hypothetical protein